MASSDPPHEGREVSNSNGTLRVRISATGLPLGVQIAPPLLSGGAEALAAEVMRLCRRAAS